MDGLTDKASHSVQSRNERETVLQSSPGTFQSSNRLQLTQFLVFGEKCKKFEEINKNLKNHSSKIIDRTEFCLTSFERGDLVLS